MLDGLRGELHAKLVIVSALEKLPTDEARLKALRDLVRDIRPRRAPARTRVLEGQLALRIEPPAEEPVIEVVDPAEAVATPPPAPHLSLVVEPPALVEVVVTAPPAIEPAKKPHRFAPRETALDKTVAYAMRKGRITNTDLRIKEGMRSRDAADKRLNAGHASGRLERVEHGVYEASSEEYQRIGIPPAKQGKALSVPYDELLKMITAARIAIESASVTA